MTVQEVLDLARQPLNDDEKVTWEDPELLKYHNAGLKELLNKRPDLFFGQFAAPPVDLIVTDTFPLDARVVPAIADYICARAHLKDSEQAVGATAPIFFQLATAGIT